MSDVDVHKALASPEAMWQRQIAAASDLAFFIDRRDPIGIQALLNELQHRHNLLFPAGDTKEVEA